MTRALFPAAVDRADGPVAVIGDHARDSTPESALRHRRFVILFSRLNSIPTYGV